STSVVSATVAGHPRGTDPAQRALRATNDHHRSQAPQVTIRAPVFREFHCRAGELPRILVEFCFEPLEQGKGIRSCAGKSSDHVTLAQLAHLLGIGLDDGLADRNLTVAADHGSPALADAQDRGAVPKPRRPALR